MHTMRIPYKNSNFRRLITSKQRHTDTTTDNATDTTTDMQTTPTLRATRKGFSRLARVASAPARCASVEPKILSWGHHDGEELDLDHRPPGARLGVENA